MVRVRANHFCFSGCRFPPPTRPCPTVILPETSTPTSAANAHASSAGRRRFLRIGLGILLPVLLLLAWLFQARRPAPLPIPVPPNLAQLDPQVRDHLTRVARFVAGQPHEPQRRAELGLAFAANNLWAQARQCFLDALQLGDSSPLPSLYAAAALIESGQTEPARAELLDVVRRFPEFAPAWQRLGTVQINLGDFPGAASSFSNVTRIVPGEWRGWAGLGEVHIRAGTPSDALAPLQRAAALAPSERPIRHLLGLAYRATGQTAEAEREAAAGQSQSLGPMEDAWSGKALDHMMSVSDQLTRADLLLAQGDPESALRRLEDTLRHHPTNLLVVSRVAAAFDAAEQSPVAWRLLEPLLAIHTNDATLLIAATHTAAALGRTNEALALARQALRAAPAFAESHVAEADALVAAGRDADAVQALRRALQFAPRNPHLLLQLGDLQWRNLALPADALASYLQARQADPLHPVPCERLAALQIERQDFLEADRAIADLRRLGARAELVDSLEADLRAARAAR